MRSYGRVLEEILHENISRYPLAEDAEHLLQQTDSRQLVQVCQVEKATGPAWLFVRDRRDSLPLARDDELGFGIGFSRVSPGSQSSLRVH